jgi:hypothetical protein
MNKKYKEPIRLNRLFVFCLPTEALDHVNKSLTETFCPNKGVDKEVVDKCPDGKNQKDCKNSNKRIKNSQNCNSNAIFYDFCRGSLFGVSDTDSLGCHDLFLRFIFSLIFLFSYLCDILFILHK